MASVNDVFGQIGAAKMFSGSISNAINTQGKKNDAKEEALEQQIAETTDEKQKKHLQKKLKRARNQNKVNKFTSKVTQGATDFLLKVLEFCDVGEKAVINWLANYIVYIVPALEVAVKAILLTNIKKMVSCALDPRIPDKFRTEGILINEQEIDPRKILFSSPYSKLGRYNYFGVYADDNDTIGVPLYSLVRAQDMNAFIWFTKNCANFVSPNIMAPEGIKEYFNCDNGASLYNTSVFIGKSNHRYLPGSTFKEKSSSNTTFLCTDSYVGDDDETSYVILPVTNSWTSVNWYKNKSNVNKERPILNLEYSNDYNMSAPIPKNNFRLKILPKPFRMASGFVTDLGNNITVMADKVDQGVSGLFGVEASTNTSWSSMKWPGVKSLIPKAARFNEKGEYSSKGRYSIYEEKYYVTQRAVDPNIKHVIIFELIPKSGTGEAVHYLLFNEKNGKYYLSSTLPTKEAENGTPLTMSDASDILIECYFGTTVYQFNYDYVMSFKLFDAKVIAANIINDLLNIDLIHINLKKKNGGDNTELSNTDQMYINNYVDKLVERIIDNEESEFTDCFYTFSNKEYEELEAKTNSKAINGALGGKVEEQITEIYNILDAYKADASREEQTEILVRAFTRAAEIVNGDNDSDSSNGAGNTVESPMNSGEEDSKFMSFLKKAIKFLIAQIVNAILTPKVLMLMQVNKKLMGNDPLSLDRNYKFTEKDILRSLEGVISGMIKQVIDSIHKELLRVILSAISQIMSSYLKELMLEYAKKWVDLLKQLLACFKFNRNKIKSGNDNSTITASIESILNQVDYADIDNLVDQVLPNTNPC